jgi:hypothetical protein
MSRALSKCRNSFSSLSSSDASSSALQRFGVFIAAKTADPAGDVAMVKATALGVSEWHSTAAMLRDSLLFVRGS